jgi:hypothetical protein
MFTHAAALHDKAPHRKTCHWATTPQVQHGVQFWASTTQPELHLKQTALHGAYAHMHRTHTCNIDRLGTGACTNARTRITTEPTLPMDTAIMDKPHAS